VPPAEDRAPRPPNRRIVQGGRAKAYRPLPAASRRRALRDGLDAYDRGDFFLAHELLEPAWMGTADLPERELLQGLIKLAAANVHAVRGNAAGIRKNLEGARARLAEAGSAGSRVGLDPAALVAAVEDRLAGRISVDDPPIPIERRS
jgi:predicted metal-dependent hydrolase